jgi:hypothetical protein
VRTQLPASPLGNTAFIPLTASLFTVNVIIEVTPPGLREKEVTQCENRNTGTQ